MRDTGDSYNNDKRPSVNQGSGPGSGFIHSVMARIGPLAGEWIVAIGCIIAASLVNQLVAPNQKLIIGGSHDEEMSYPLMPQQVPEGLLLGIAGVLPLIAVCVLGEMTAEPGQGRRDMHVNALMLVQSIGGAVLVTTVAKKQAGRPRPCFYAMCEWQNATEPAGCTAKTHTEWEARQSFPSGHSSFSFAGLLFLSLLLIDKFKVMGKKRKLPLSIPAAAWQLVACIPAFIAMWISITRVVDYWHNYDDILAGSVIGGLSATLAFNQRERYNQAWFSDRVSVGPPPSDTIGLSSAGDDASNEV